jgi:hypothetical protein
MFFTLSCSSSVCYAEITSKVGFQRKTIISDAQSFVQKKTKLCEKFIELSETKIAPLH